MGSAFEVPSIGGVTIGLIFSMNVIAIRYFMQYFRETREEYVKKLTQAVIESEYQKTENMRLRFELEKFKSSQ